MALAKTASHKNGISKLLLLVFSSTTNTLLIKPTPTIRHKLEKVDFKMTMTMGLNHTTNLRIRFKKSLSSALGM